MKTLRFKTSINCSNCVRAVTPFLSGEKRISRWEVDTTSPLRILTVSGDDIDAVLIRDLLKQAGYKAEEIE